MIYKRFLTFCDPCMVQQAPTEMLHVAWANNKLFNLCQFPATICPGRACWVVSGIVSKRLSWVLLADFVCVWTCHACFCILRSCEACAYCLLDKGVPLGGQEVCVLLLELAVTISFLPDLFLTVRSASQLQ